MLLALSVKTLLPVAGLVLNPDEMPLGKTEVTVNPTLPLKPFNAFTVIVEVPAVPPCTIVKLVGDADKLKSGAGGAAFTVRETEVVCVRPPEVPLIVRETVPNAAVPLAVRESVLLPVAGFGENVAVTPLGKPAVTDKLTLPLKPFAGLILTVVFPATPP